MKTKDIKTGSKNIILSLCVILFMTICYTGCGDTDSQAVQEEAPAEAAHPGMKIYKKYCITCHGSDGSMGSNGAFNLRETTLTLDEKVAVITNGRNTMTAFEKVIKPEEIRAVAEYTEKFRQ